MIKLTRRYIDHDNYNYIMDWGTKYNERDPIRKPSFNKYLKQYIEVKGK